MLDKLSQLNPDLPDLNKRISYFLQSMEGEDYDGILLLTYPAIFDVVPKSILRQKIVDTFHGEEMDISMDVFDINHIGQPIVADEGQYVKVDYTMLMSFTLRYDDTDDEATREEKKQLYLKSFRIAYGKANLWFEETTQAFCFHKNNTMIAIKNDRSPKWTFMTYQKGEALEMFIPKNVLLLLDMQAGNSE